MDGSVEKNTINYWTLDFLKYFLAILVIIRHIGQSFFSSDSLFVKLFSCSISPIAVPTFFAVSGFLLFRKPVSASVLKKQLLRIIKLYLVWTLVFSPLIILNAIKSDSFTMWLLKFLKNFLFSGSYYHLWFLPSLAVAICLIFFISKKIKHNGILLMIGLFLYMIGTLVDTYHFISPFFEWELYKEFFLTTRNGLFFGFFFVAVGKTIAQNQTIIKKMKTRFLCVLIVIVLFMLGIEGWFLCEVNSCSVVNMNFSSIIIAPSLLIVAIKSSGRLCYSNGKQLRNMSTFLFCFHPLVIFVISYIKTGSIASTFIVLILSIIIAYLFIRLMDRIHFLKILI